MPSEVHQAELDDLSWQEEARKQRERIRLSEESDGYFQPDDAVEK